MNNAHFTVKVLKTNPSLIRMIQRKRPHLKRKYIESMLNTMIVTPNSLQRVLTSSQLASLTGKRPDSIVTMTTVQIKNGEHVIRLTRVLPFMELDENGNRRENTKKIFILLDQQCEEFLVENNK